MAAKSKAEERTAVKPEENGSGIEERKIIDLNQLRAARLEKLGKGPCVQFGERVFQCPPEIPFRVIESFGRMEKAQLADDGYASSAALLDSVRFLLAADQFAQFMDENPSTDDMVSFITGVFTEYGVAEGESSASPAS